MSGTEHRDASKSNMQTMICASVRTGWMWGHNLQRTIKAVTVSLSQLTLVVHPPPFPSLGRRA